jgi:DNA replication protein DnaC
VLASGHSRPEKYQEDAEPRRSLCWWPRWDRSRGLAWRRSQARSVSSSESCQIILRRRGEGAAPEWVEDSVDNGPIVRPIARPRPEAGRHPVRLPPSRWTYKSSLPRTLSAQAVSCCAQGGIDHPRYLLRLIELELIDRERRTVERRIRAARFPAVKSLDTFDFTAIPSLNKMMVLELARCEYILRRENVIALGNSGTGKSHVALALGLAACQKGFTVAFTTAAALVSQLMEARDERRLLKLQRDLAAVKLLIVDELGYVPLSQTGAELLFAVLSQHCERGSTIITSNLPFEDWTQVLVSERLCRVASRNSVTGCLTKNVTGGSGVSSASISVVSFA